MKLLDLLVLVGVILVYIAVSAGLSRLEKHYLDRLGHRKLGVQRLLRPLGFVAFAVVLHAGLALRDHASKLTFLLLIASLGFLIVRLLELVFFDLYLQRITGVLVPSVARSFAGGALIVVALVAFANLALNVPLPQILIASAIGLGLLVLLFNDTYKGLKTGVRISLQNDFRVGDVLRVGDHAGEVISFGWRSTRLRTQSGSEVVVPNTMLFDAPVETWRETDKQHQGRVEVEVPLILAPNDVTRELQQGALELEGVLDEPAPRARFVGGRGGVGHYLVEIWAGSQSERHALEEELTVALWYRLQRVGMGTHTSAEADGSIREFVENIPFLAVARRAQVDAVAQRARLERYGRGEYLCRQGEAGDSLYVVRRGELEVSVDAAQGRRVVSAIVSGGFVGERSLLTGEPRNAHVLAKTDCEVLVIRKDDLLDLLQADPRLADEIGEEMERREQESQKRLTTQQAPRKLGSRIRDFFGLGSEQR